LSPQHPPTPSSHLVAKLSMFSVLVVEDCPTNNLLLVRLLKSIGFISIFSAHGGLEALGVFSAYPEIDLVLSDLNMPDMSGTELAAQIRALPFQRSPRMSSSDLRWPVIIAISGERIVDVSERCSQASMDSLVTKPVSRVTLISLVTEWLLKREQHLPVAAPIPSV
jgi:CheY-like chemotaxis protein